jgi:hypothetical protein
MSDAIDGKVVLLGGGRGVAGASGGGIGTSPVVEQKQREKEARGR